MGYFVYKHTLTAVLLFAGFIAFSQKSFDIKTTKAEVSLEGKTLIGYTSNFDFDRTSVRRGWWEFTRGFGTPLNMKTYYKVTIPASSTDGNTDLVIYCQTEGSDSGGVDFFLGLEETTFESQAKNLLIDFKKKFYIDQIITNIENKEKEAKMLSEDYNATVLEDQRETILDKMTALESEIELLKEEIRNIENQ